ncbi:hypothetical protein Tcan_03063 [Toxocara canis]|uniref:F-box domain-containing protein n=1 Tax=Toxocara canis TaxID=6265 RepID=A0A0B2VD88_TOXCA|nr:hypothetical protein Tcan_03063 [Toxocara canis]
MDDTDAGTTMCFPFGNRYNKVDKRYKFTKRTDFTTLGAQYPIHETKRVRQYYMSCMVHPYQKRCSTMSNTSSSNVKSIFPGDLLPDVVLLTIFKYMHPLDLINGVSTVSKRWNKLVNTPSNYRNVRVIVDEDSVRSGSAKAFLHKAAMCIRELCLDYETKVSPGCLTMILPECMPNVTVLDIGLIDDVKTNIDRLITCFPNVEILNMDHVGNMDEESLMKLISQNAFLRLRRFYLNLDWDLRHYAFTKLISWDRPLEVLRFQGTSEPNFRGLERAPFIPTLTELYLHQVYLDNPCYAVIGQLKNLKKLSIISSIGTPDEELLRLKNLSNLEHFHMDCCGQDCDFSPMGVAELFRLPNENPSNFFPYRLKYLRFSDCYYLDEESVPELIKSCPELESLNITRDEFMGEEAFAMIIKNLKKLRFLDARELGEMRCDALRHLSNEDLPELQFLALSEKQIEQTILEELSKERPKLIISNRRNYIINWREQDGELLVNNQFEGDLNAVLNDLCEMEGFCCMDSFTAYPCGEED